MSQLYPSFKESLLKAFFLGETFPNDVLMKVCFVGAGFTFNSTDRTLADIEGIVSPGVLIPGASISPAGTVSAANLIPAIDGNETTIEITGFVLYAEDSVTAETQLIGHINSLQTGILPITVDGPTLNVRWPSGGIFGI